MSSSETSVDAAASAAARGGMRLLQGNEVCAEASLYAGMRFFAGYPITPSTEIAERLAERLPQVGGSFMQMEDEIGSMCAVIGASLAGLKSMTATSGPGFSLMQEAIGYAVMAEVPCVVVDVQRGGPSTGLPTHASQADVMQVRYGTHGDHSIVCLTASNHQDLFGIVVDAFNFSETFRTPAVVLIDEIVAHMREPLRIPAPGELELTERLLTNVPRDVDYHPYFPREDDRLPMSNFGGVHRYNVTGLVHDMWGFPSENPKIANDLIHHLYLKLENRKRMLTRFKEWNLEDAEIVLISYGASARSARHIMENRRSVGVPIGMIELQTLWPFPSELIRAKCRQADYIVVVEMNMGQVVHEVKKAVDRPERVFLSNRVDGEMITPTDIKNLVRVIQGKGI